MLIKSTPAGSTNTFDGAGGSDSYQLTNDYVRTDNGSTTGCQAGPTAISMAAGRSTLTITS